jgi:hypothetical protein
MASHYLPADLAAHSATLNAHETRFATIEETVRDLGKKLDKVLFLAITTLAGVVVELGLRIAGHH